MPRFAKRIYFDGDKYIKFMGLLTQTSLDDIHASYSHPNDHFNIITSGSLTITANGDSYPISAGSMIFFPKDMEYSISIPKSYSQISIELSGTHRDTWDEYFPLPLPEKFDVRHIPRISDDNFYEIREIMLYDREIEKAQAKNTAERYILAFLAGENQNERGFKGKFSELMLDCDPCRLTLSQISEALHYSKTHTERLMRETFGCSVNEYLHRARLAAATDLLLSTDLPISKIAEQTGFYDASHFSTVFKRETGVSPKKYRKKSVE